MRVQAAAGGASLLLALLLWPAMSLAFYEVGGEEAGLNLSGALTAGLGMASYPAGLLAADDRLDELWQGDLRLLADASRGEGRRARLNILQAVHSPAPAWADRLANPVRADVERSALLFWPQEEAPSLAAELVMDAGYLEWSDDNDSLTLGRQPVQLSVTSSFTVNDFFAPFAPQQFYRVYKPGVDALRYEHRLANLVQLSLLGVLGYDEEPGSASGWSRAPAWPRTSVLGRLVFTAGSLEWGVLGGSVREEGVVGGSLQGELADWLGIRAEGHYRSGQDGSDGGPMLSMGLEHRFPSTLTVRLEQMYNERGYASIAAADRALRAGTLAPGYLGQHYTAVDLGYEFSPLLTGEFLYLGNWSDRSHVFALYGVYSLADEAELALQVNLPEGDAPDRQSLGSELGLQPVSFAIVYRLYF